MTARATRNDFVKKVGDIMSGNLQLLDNVKLQFGTDSDNDAHIVWDDTSLIFNVDSESASTNDAFVFNAEHGHNSSKLFSFIRNSAERLSMLGTGQMLLTSAVAAAGDVFTINSSNASTALQATIGSGSGFAATHEAVKIDQTFGTFQGGSGFVADSSGSNAWTDSAAFKATGDWKQGLNIELDQSTARAIKITGSYAGSLSYGVLDIENTSGATDTGNSLIRLSQENATANGDMIKIIGKTGTPQFAIDSGTNIIQTTGAYILARGTIGSPENLLKYSEQQSNSVWQKIGGLTVSAGADISPDGVAGGSDRISWYDSISPYPQIQQDRTDITNLSGRTFTASGWFRRISGNGIFMVVIAASSGETTNIGLENSFSIGETPIGQWVYISYTGDFDAGIAAGSYLEFYVRGGLYMVANMWGWSLTETADKVAYSPTVNYTYDSPVHGVFANGLLNVSAGLGASTLKIAEGGSQGTTDLFQLVQNDNSSKEIWIDSNYQMNLNDGVNLALGTSSGTKIGTSTSQKLGMWGVTPVAQPSALTGSDATALDGTIATNDTVTDNIRTRVDELEAKLQAIGAIA